MAVSLNPQTQKLLEDRLRASAYTSVDALVHAALDALAWQESNGLDEPTLDAIDRAEDQVDRGEYRAWKDVREEVRAKLLGH